MQNNSKLLLGILVVLTLLSYLVINNKVNETNDEQKLIPELQSQINDIDTIILSKNKRRWK